MEQKSRLSKFPASLRVFFQSLPTWWDDWVGQALLGIIWLFSWVTIILGPPVTFGLCYHQSRLIRGESLGIPGIIEGVKKYFIKSWLWMLANVAVILLTLNGVYFYGQIETDWGVALRVIMMAILITWVAVQFYTLPFFVIQEKESLRLAWRNAFFTFMAAPFYSMMLYILTAILIGLSFTLIIPLFLGLIPFTSVLFNMAVRERVEVFKAQVEAREKKEAERKDE